MKKTIQSETTFCDVCGQNKYVQTCLRCGKDVCWDCRDKGFGKEYPHAVYFSGSGDGFYCKECDEILGTSGSDKLHNAYVRISYLRQESKLWSDDFSVRSKQAEQELESLLEK